MNAAGVRTVLATLIQAGLVVALMVAAASEVWTQRGARVRRQPRSRRGSRRSACRARPLGDGPWVLDTAEQHKIKVSIVAGGLANPWSLAWLPDGDMLITERPGRLRLLKNGVLDPDADQRRARGEGAAAVGADGRGAPSTLRREPPRLPHLQQGPAATA